MKTPIAIILGALILAASIYLSSRPNPTEWHYAQNGLIRWNDEEWCKATQYDPVLDYKCRPLEARNVDE